MRFIKCLLILTFMLVPYLTYADDNQREVLTLRFPFVESDPVYKERSIYFRDLLHLVMSKTGLPFELVAVTVPPVPTNRTVIMMDQGRYDVSWVHTDSEREQDLRPIRYPIFRGLGGWRLFLIRAQDVRKFYQVDHLEQLRKYRPGQGHDWPDTEILRHNQFQVVTSFSRDLLLKMLNHKRIDFFPRGLNEIWDEVALPDAQGIVVDPRLVLRYPTAFYLYVSKKDEVLAQLLERGFELAIKDGSFLELFYQYMGETIKRANLVDRHIIDIRNPMVSDQTPLERKELWFNIDEL